MNTNAIKETATLIANIEPLLFTEIKQAEHHGNDTIRISVPRAREIHSMAIALEKRLKNILATQSNPTETATDRHLNKMFGIN